MATRLAAAVIIVSLMSLVVATMVGLTTGRDLGKDLFVDRLDSLQTSAAFDTTAEMNSLANATTAVADSPQAAVAIDAFSDAYDALVDDLGEDITDHQDEIEALLLEYQPRYIDPQDAAGRALEFRDILAETPTGVRLQSIYSVSIPAVADSPDQIDDAGDGSEWSEVHAILHPVYRDVADRLRLVDLLLIEPVDETVVYSVRKNPDLGTSLGTGPFSGSVLADTVGRVIDDPGAGTLTSDLSFYPTSLAPLGVIASPVLSDGELVGVLAAMYDSVPLTEILTADGEWAESGYPDSSQTYLSGTDDTTRTEPRGFIEDPEQFLDAAEEAGNLDEEERLVIEARGTTVLTLRTDESSTIAAKEADESIGERQSIGGSDVFSTIAPLEASGLPWLVIAEIDVTVAESDIDDFRDLLIVGVAIFMVLLAFAAVYWANGIVRPIRQISDRLATADDAGLGERLGVDPKPLDVPDRSPIEFHRLATSFESMAAGLRNQRAHVAAARAERLALLRKMLPPTVAQRVADGQIQALEEIPQVTVGVIVVEGLSALVQVGSDTSSRDLVDQLLSEIDELAERHGIERIKLVGDAYFAAVGHDRPYLDHAPRMVSFASDARDAIRELSSASSTASDDGAGLDLAVGIHTGPVTVGMTGGARLVYDVWGTTVTVAHAIARRARRGQILVTDATRALLPESIGLEHDDAASGEILDVWSVEPATVRGSA